MHWRGFEPESDVLAHSVRLARLTGFKSHDEQTRVAKTSAEIKLSCRIVATRKIMHWRGFEPRL